jgi:hypothetical protein
MIDYMARRVNFKWNINEILALQREYELLEMTVQEIAAKHERNVAAIAFKLEKEGFIDSRHNARGLRSSRFSSKRKPSAIAR